MHNVLWAHYKAAVFSQLNQLARQAGDVTVLVAQIATTERSRLQLGDPAQGEHDYPHVLLFDRPLEDVSAWERFWALFSQVRRFKPHVVNLTGYYDVAQVALFLYCRLVGIRTVLSSESNLIDQDRQGYKEQFKRFLVRRFDGFFCFGTLSAQYLQTLGARPDQILTDRAAVINDQVIRAAYDQALPRRTATLREKGFASRNFVYVGRLLEIKNVHRLLTAFAQARKASAQGAEWGLLLLGEGPYKTTLQQQCATEGLTSVHFLPGTGWRQVPVALTLADALVLPSYSEPWGLVVNEAMVCGLPVLVSDRCGCAPDLVVNGENGFTFDPYEVAELQQRLQLVMEAPEEERLRLGAASQRRIQAFSLPAVAAQMMAGFRRVVGGF